MSLYSQNMDFEMKTQQISKHAILRHFVPDTINYGRFYRVLRLSVWRYSTCRSLFSESAQFIFLSSQKPDVHPYIRGTAWQGYDGFMLAKWIVAPIQRKQQFQ